MSCSLQPQTFFIMMGLLAFLWVLIAIVVQSIRRPDYDDYFDEPENWGRQMSHDYPFDPRNPYDALADVAHQLIAELGPSLVNTEQFRALADNPSDQYEALLLGMMTGLAGIMMAPIDPQHHRAVVADLYAAIPVAVDHAREILSLPPLEALQ